MHNNAGVES
jgi:hypothetical protein